MKCDGVSELLSLYLDNEIHEEKKAEIQAHLEECASCRTVFEETARSVSMMSELRKQNAPEELKLRLKEKLRPQVMGMMSRGKASSPVFRWRKAVLVKTAAMFLIVSLVSTFFIAHFSDEGKNLYLEGGRPVQVSEGKSTEADSPEKEGAEAAKKGFRRFREMEEPQAKDGSLAARTEAMEPEIPMIAEAARDKSAENRSLSMPAPLMAKKAGAPAVLKGEAPYPQDEDAASDRGDWKNAKLSAGQGRAAAEYTAKPERKSEGYIGGTSEKKASGTAEALTVVRIPETHMKEVESFISGTVSLRSGSLKSPDDSPDAGFGKAADREEKTVQDKLALEPLNEEQQKTPEGAGTAQTVQKEHNRMARPLTREVYLTPAEFENLKKLITSFSREKADSLTDNKAPGQLQDTEAEALTAPGSKQESKVIPADMQQDSGKAVKEAKEQKRIAVLIIFY